MVVSNGMDEVAIREVAERGRRILESLPAELLARRTGAIIVVDVNSGAYAFWH